MHWYSRKLDKKYYFKHNALADDDNPEFCMGDVYDNHDWTVEPKGSWKDVLKEHAQELRDTYKYIRLWYSGGSDSQTVLNTFVENGIHLDEIGIVRMSPVNNFNAYSEHELNSVAIPQARALANKIPKTKIALYHYGYEQYKNWIDNHFVLGNTNVRSFHMFLPTTVHKLMPGINDREGLININCVGSYVLQSRAYLRRSGSTLSKQSTSTLTSGFPLTSGLTKSTTTSKQVRQHTNAQTLPCLMLCLDFGS